MVLLISSTVSSASNRGIRLESVKELGDQANGDYAKLEIVEIPDDVEFEIDEYDGIEKVSEKHRTWY